MQKIVIFVKGGMVQDVYASREDIDVTVVDLDTEDGVELEAVLHLENGIPEHHIY